MIKKHQVLLAQKECAAAPVDHKDVFMKLASFNLLNAAVKTPEYQLMVSYSQFKPLVGAFIEHILTADDLGSSVDYISINPSEACIFIKCRGLQFSFHQVTYTPLLLQHKLSSRNPAVKWEEIRLQKIAEEIFILASMWKNVEIDDTAFACNINRLRHGLGLTITLPPQPGGCSDGKIRYYATVCYSPQYLLSISEAIAGNPSQQPFTLLRDFDYDSLLASFNFRDRKRLGIILKSSPDGLHLFTFTPTENGEMMSKTTRHLESPSQITLTTNPAFLHLLHSHCP